MIIGRLKMTSALSRAEVICVRRGYRLLHNAGLANTCIAFFQAAGEKPLLKPVPLLRRCLWCPTAHSRDCNRPSYWRAPFLTRADKRGIPSDQEACFNLL